jgi:hypothetical protein
MSAHQIKTMERLETDKVILKIQDTTELNYSSRENRKEIGYIRAKKGYGLLVHTTLAITDKGLPIGILKQDVWGRDIEQKGKAKDRRDKPIEEKESYRWLQSISETEQMLTNQQLQVSIADREADIYELFAQERKTNSHFLIRAGQDRLVDSIDRKLFDTMNNAQTKELITVEVDRRKGQSSREATLAVKYQEITFKAPAKKEPEKIKLNAILVKEVNPPEGIEAIEWLLLTTLEINSLDDALKYVRWYSYRWLIERFHYVLKSGCLIEEIQLEESDRIKKALSTYSIVACKILSMTYKARIEPESSVEEILEENEWKVLHALVNKSYPKKPPTIKEAIRLIARLGGFIGRKSDGDPGVKTIWQGYRRLQESIEAINTLKNLSLPGL